MSDAEILKYSGILQKEFWENGDAVMADQSFAMEDLLSPMGVFLIMPSLLRGKDEATAEEVKES